MPETKIQIRKAETTYLPKPKPTAEAFEAFHTIFQVSGEYAFSGIVDSIDSFGRYTVVLRNGGVMIVTPETNPEVLRIIEGYGSR